MKLKIELELDNAAFEDDPEEVGRILEGIASSHCTITTAIGSATPGSFLARSKDGEA